MRLLAFISSLFLLLLLLACGSSSTSTPSASTTPVVTITASTSNATVVAGASQSFSASVSGTSNTVVTWSIQEGSAGGSIDATGKYTAPATPGTYHVIATSAADSSKSVVITITVTAPPPPPAVSITPATVTLTAGSSQQFTATVSGSSNTAVTWSIQEGSAGGAIDAGGKYTAPAAAGIYHVVARLVATPSISAIASVTVTALSSGIGYFTIQPPLLSPPPSFPISDAVVNLLADGSVLATGGAIYSIDQFHFPTYFSTAYRYVVASDGSVTGSAIGNMVQARVGHTATLLLDGRVLLVGGDPDQGITQVTAEIYDPGSNTFTSTSSFPVPALTPGIDGNPNIATSDQRDLAVRLPDGTVLVVVPQYAGEIYDPASGTFGAPIPASAITFDTMMAPLLDGRILIAGGCYPCSGNVGASANAFVFDSATKQFSPTGSLATPRNQGTAVTLADGRALVLSGQNIPTTGNYTFLKTAEIYEPGSGSFVPIAATMNSPGPVTAVRLASGKVLIVGSDPATPTEIFDPTTKLFTQGPVTGLTNHYKLHALRLPNGLVMLFDGSPYSAIAIYHP